MVQIQRKTQKRISPWVILLPVLTAIGIVVWFFFLLIHMHTSEQPQFSPKETLVQVATTSSDTAASMKSSSQSQPQQQYSCPYSSLNDLSEEERHPRASSTRHMVDPPSDTRVTLVCCETTVGPWNFVIHHSWAPIGAQRVLDMVESNYFGNQPVPLMRCVPNFLCQFGLAGEASAEYGKRLEDDPNWLPEGPAHRMNELGVRRFQRGYFAYAGAGKRSRTNQLIVALKDNGPLAGGSPWEVPWGELVGNHSFETLSKVYTGYGEKGPSQGMLHKEGAIEKVKQDYPKLDFILSCHVADDTGVTS